MSVKKILNSPISWFIIFFIIYAALAGDDLLKPSVFPHFVYQAQAFLNGRLNIDPLPPHVLDFTFVGEKAYLPVPVFPAVVILPVVAIFGLDTPDVLISVIFGALNIGLFFILLNRAAKFYEKEPSVGFKSAMMLLFGLGSAHGYCAPLGHVWHIAQVMALTFTLVVLIELFGKQRIFIIALFAAFAGM